jgi:hypothetical protein
MFLLTTLEFVTEHEGCSDGHVAGSRSITEA